MISFDVVIPSASRPHIFKAALVSLFQNIDQSPSLVIIHDDAAFPGRQDQIRSVIETCIPPHVERIVLFDDPPLSHGPSLWKCLQLVRSPYVLYMQDDCEVIRALPIQIALDVMHHHHVHQIRFNKRATMRHKMTWTKKEFTFESYAGVCTSLPAGVHDWMIHEWKTQESAAPAARICRDCRGYRDVTLTVADHWYFQLGLWRLSRIKPVCDWYMQKTSSFHEHAEIKVNHAMNRGVGEFNQWALSSGYELPPSQSESMDQDVRARVQRTYIWGPIGEDQFMRNLAEHPDDWALVRPRGGSGPSRVDSQAREVS